MNLDTFFTREKIEQAYFYDPMIQKFVDTLVDLILNYRLTPSEVRIFAMFACEKAAAMSGRIFEEESDE